MGIPRKSVTIHYRRLEDVTNAFAGKTLEAAIREAMNFVHDGGPLSDHWKRRAWAMPPSHEDILLSNIHHDGGTYYFGDLTMYSRGFMQALLKEKNDTPILDIEQQCAPDGQEYVHSIMYWMVIGNHAFILQSQSLTTKQVENYFTWLLKDRTTTINATGQVILQAKFDANEVGGDLDDIKELIIGGTATPTATIDLTQKEEENGQLRTSEVSSYKALSEERSGANRAVDVLKAVMKNEADVEKLLQSVPDEASLEVSVHIGYKSRKRKVSRAPMQQALRNLPEGEVTAVGKTGNLIGSDIRLSYPASIIRLGSLLDPLDTQRALQDAYTYLVKNGKIDP